MGSAETDGTFLWVVMVWLFGVNCLCSERIQVEDLWRCGVDFTCLCETRTVSRHQCGNLSMKILSHRISFANFTFLHHSSRSWAVGWNLGTAIHNYPVRSRCWYRQDYFERKYYILRRTPAFVASPYSITVDVPNFRNLVLQTRLKVFNAMFAHYQDVQPITAPLDVCIFRMPVTPSKFSLFLYQNLYDATGWICTVAWSRLVGRDEFTV